MNNNYTLEQLQMLYDFIDSKVDIAFKMQRQEAAKFLIAIRSKLLSDIRYHPDYESNFDKKIEAEFQLQRAIGGCDLNYNLAAGIV